MHRGLTSSVFVLLACGTALGQPAAVPTPAPGRLAQLANATDIRAKLGIVPAYRDVLNIGRTKIAVLDSGFEGFDPQRPCLPKSATIIEHYDQEWVQSRQLGDPMFRKGFEPGNAHGRLMAQSVWATTGQRPEGPQFYLLNANGPTLFRRAVSYAIEQKVDVILFSGHFEGGGNYDGTGPINATVDEAIRAGVIWINAAGNHHGRVYSGRVIPGVDGHLRFGRNNRLSALPFHNRLDENNVTITLTWNDYHRELEDAGTTKDLDLFVLDAAGREIARSALKQIAAAGPTNPGESRNPRERLSLPLLARGTYYIKVRQSAGEFGRDDHLRILINASRVEPYPDPETGKPTDPIYVPDATNAEELFPPADHPRVVTVGDLGSYSARGPTADRRVKPDVVLAATPARWTNGEVTAGTSYSAAYFAGAMCLLKGERADFQGDDVHRWLAELRKESQQRSTVRVAASGRIGSIDAAITPRNGPVAWRMPTPGQLRTLIELRGPTRQK